MNELETNDFSELLKNETSVNEVDILDILSHLDDDLSLNSCTNESIIIEENQTQETQNIETIFSSFDEFEESNLKIDDIFLNERKWGLKSLLEKIKIKQKVSFVGHYILVSVVVFFILLWISNYSAYSKMAYNYINPNYLKNSSRDILNAIDDSKIKVYADSLNVQENYLFLFHSFCICFIKYLYLFYFRTSTISYFFKSVKKNWYKKLNLLIFKFFS